MKWWWRVGRNEEEEARGRQGGLGLEVSWQRQDSAPVERTWLLGDRG